MEIVCKECGQKRKHKAFQLCTTCYMRTYSREYYQKLRKKIRELEAKIAKLEAKIAKLEGDK